MIGLKIRCQLLWLFLIISFVFVQITGAPAEDKSVRHGGMAHDSAVISSHEETGHSVMNTAKDQDMNHGGHDHVQMVMAEEKENPELSRQVKVEEQLGKYAALDTQFKDENGNPVVLSDLFDKPVVLLPVYFTCTSICNFLQAELANALNQVNQVPGRDFNIITLSFDDDEDPPIAKTSRQNYNNLIQRDFPQENWFYLTGDRENILKLTQSLGYYFIKKDKHVYIHPSVLVVLSKDGKITRYLYGPSFLPFDMGMALSEADHGKIGASIKRGVLSFCFDYDPANKTYVFKMFRITGTVILILLIGFIVFLVYPSKRDKK